MGVTAIFYNLVLGYRERRASMLILMVLTVNESIANFLIADIDSPYQGLIRVVPQDLISVSH